MIRSLQEICISLSCYKWQTTEILMTTERLFNSSLFPSVGLFFYHCYDCFVEVDFFSVAIKDISLFKIFVIHSCYYSCFFGARKKEKITFISFFFKYSLLWTQLSMFLESKAVLVKTFITYRNLLGIKKCLRCYVEHR